MAITLNKKFCLEFFEIFFSGFWSTVSKLMVHTVYLVLLIIDLDKAKVLVSGMMVFIYLFIFVGGRFGRKCDSIVRKRSKGRMEDRISIRFAQP